MDIKDLFIGRSIALFLQKKQKKEKNIYELHSASFQGVNRFFFFFFAYIIAAAAAPAVADETAGVKNNGKYFLQRVEIKNYNVLIDGGNFYNQPIDDLIK